MPVERVARMIAPLERAASLPSSSDPSATLSGIAFVRWGGGGFGTDGEANLDTCYASSFARSLHLEALDLEVCVIDLPTDLPETEIAEFVVNELGGLESFRAAGYTRDGVRLEPRHRLRQPVSDQPLVID